MCLNKTTESLLKSGRHVLGDERMHTNFTEHQQVVGRVQARIVIPVAYDRYTGYTAHTGSGISGITILGSMDIQHGGIAQDLGLGSGTTGTGKHREHTVE